jgi:hypothetical protein
MYVDDYYPPPKRPGFFATLFGVIAGIDIATDVGIMGMTMFTVANLVVIEAVEVWTKRRDSQMFQR